MAKQGMKRPGADEVGNKRPKNDVAPVQEIKGKAKEVFEMTKILVIDDDVNISELLRMYLEKEGYEVGNKRPKNDVAPVQEIKGKAKSGKVKVENKNNTNKFSNEAAIWQDERRDGPGGDYS